MNPDALCRNCRFGFVKARELCSACLEHERRHGTARPARLILLHIDRIIWRHAKT